MDVNALHVLLIVRMFVIYILEGNVASWRYLGSGCHPGYFLYGFHFGRPFESCRDTLLCHGEA